MASMLRRVSSRVSPFEVAEVPMLKLMTSADSSLAASSKVVRVRVQVSKNRLVAMRPRNSGTFLTGRPGSAANDSAVSSICSRS